MDRDQKAAVIDQVTADIQEADAIIAVDYRGITVAQAAELRTRLRAADTSFRIVKNTLTERAADQAGAAGLKPYLEGPTAMAFVRGDVAAAAKALTDFRRAAGLLEVKGGLMNGEPIDAEQIDAIAKLPSREVLYGRLVGMVASPLTGLASALGGLIGGLARQLQALADQNLVGGAAAGPAPAEAAAAEPADATASAVPAETATEEVPADDTTAAATADEEGTADTPAAAGSEAAVDPQPEPDSDTSGEHAA